MKFRKDNLKADSIFLFDAARKERAHGPKGYVQYESYQPWLRDEFTFRCAYCLIREKWYPNEHRSFTIDHFIPQITDEAKITEYDNLIYVCARCNSYKREGDGVLDPCAIAMSHHLQITEDGRFEPLSPAGELHIEVLRLNHPNYIEYRQRLIELIRDAQQNDDEKTIRAWLGFPESLPDLKSLRPPQGNSRPGGATTCYFELRRDNRLPEIY